MKGRLTPDSWLINKPIAHRGWYDEFLPENTAPAYELAIKKGYPIELDVQLSSDGVLFCYHDNNSKRVCGVDKDVRTMTFNEVKTLRPNGKEYDIMSFEEFLKFIDGKMLILDQTKLPGEEVYIEAITKEDVWDAIYHLKVRG